MTAAEALRAAIPRLADAGIEGANRDARLLLAHAMAIAADRLTLHLSDTLEAQAQSRFDAAIAARMARQPVAQITGQRLFWGRSFTVTRDTLDPRPETETLVDAALSHPFTKALDLGTGTGCILLSLLAEMPIAQGVGCDVSTQALEVAKRNAQGLGLERRARFVQSDWFSNVQGRFDLIVSNPPYISELEMKELSPEVLDWEPHLALTPGGDGLQAYRILAAGAGARLMQGGRILLEIGPSQGEAVRALLRAQGFEAITILPDMDGRDRVVMAQKSEGA